MIIARCTPPATASSFVPSASPTRMYRRRRRHQPSRCREGDGHSKSESCRSASRERAGNHSASAEKLTMISISHQHLTRRCSSANVQTRPTPRFLRPPRFRNKRHQFRNAAPFTAKNGSAQWGVSLRRAGEFTLLVHFQTRVTFSMDLLRRSLRYSGRVQRGDTRWASGVDAASPVSTYDTVSRL